MSTHPLASARHFTTTIVGALAVVITVILTWSAPVQTQRPAGEKIIVSGASGQLGDLVVTELLARGVPASDLILVSRTPDSLKDYASQGASVRFGDFTQPESLPAAYKGGTRLLLISISGGVSSRPEAHGRAIDAAVAVGVKHIVYTSWVALSRDDASGIGVDHHQTEELLRASGVAWTMLRNSLYAELLLAEAAQMASTGRATVAPDVMGIGYVTRQDCAAAAAAVLTTPGHENTVYDITGPELVGTLEVAAAVTAVTGRAVEVVTAAPTSGGPGGGVGGASTAVVSTHVADLTGRPATSVRQLLEANREALAVKP